MTVPLGARLGGLTCCPCGRPATAGWRLAGPRARAERLGAPPASAARRAPPREWAAAARLLVCRTPAPRPARPGEKALIGKIAQERGWRGAAGARRELRRPGRRRRPPTPDELTVQRGEGRAQGVSGPASQPSSKSHLLQGAAHSHGPPPLPRAWAVQTSLILPWGWGVTGPCRCSLSAYRPEVRTGAGTRAP